jgi:hypothetical protein
VRQLLAKVEENPNNFHNYRNDFDWFVGFTRASCNFSQIVNSLPAFVKETYFHQHSKRDIVQCIGNTFHPSVFGHSSVLVVHTQGSLKRAVMMEKLSRSTTATPLGIPLPKCPTCGEAQFLVGKIHSGRLNMQCRGCYTSAERIKVPTPLMPSNRAFSLLPYPLPNTLPDSLTINWPKQIRQSVKPPLKPQDDEGLMKFSHVQHSVQSQGNIQGLVRI